MVGEYSLLDQVHAFAGFLDTFPVLYPQLQRIDFRTDVSRLDVPVYLFQGRHEAPSRAALADQWFAALEAPAKALTIAKSSGHRALWEQPAEFHRFMTRVVLTGTQGGGGT
jgi:pimeloyl-ACP methyl ester carboxylesterase